MKKLSDNEQRPRKLEDIFRDGMDEAEFAPSDRLWERIEQNLDIKQAGFYKKRMAWYQMVAAACITLVVFAGAYLFYDLRNEHRPINLAQKSVPAVEQQHEISQQKTIQPNDVNAETLANQSPQPTPVIKPATLEKSENTVTVTLKKEQFAATPAPEALTASRHRSNTNRKSQTSGGLKKDITPINTGQTEQEFTPTIATASQESAEALAPETPEKEAEILKPINSLALMNNKYASRDSIHVRALPEVPVNSAPVFLAAAEKPKAKGLARWSFGGKYGSHYFDQNISLAQNTGRSLQATGSTAGLAAPFANSAPTSYSQAMTEYDKKTTPEYSYNTAVMAAYEVNKHWALETGLDYTQNVASTSSSYLFRSQASTAKLADRFNTADPANVSLVENVILPTTAFMASLNPGADASNTQVIKTPAFDTQYRYRLVGIPVKVNYRTNSHKSFYFASVGFLTNLLMQAHILSDSPRVPDTKYNHDPESPFRNVQMAASASIGKGFVIGKSFNVRAGLEATQYLSTLAANPEMLEGKHRKPYTIGLAVSSSYNLGR